MSSTLKAGRASRTMTFIFVAMLGGGVSAFSFAQESGAPPEGPMVKDRELIVGLGAAYQPVYLGSDEHKIRALPMISARWKNGWFAGVTGIGYRFASDSPFSFGVQLGFNPGRDEDDSQALRGMGDIEARPEAGAFATYRFRPGLSLSSSLRYGSGVNRDGLLVDLGLRSMVPLAGGHRIIGGLSASYANRSYTESFFGVTPDQALTSGYAVYAPSGGLRDVSANIGYGYSFTPHLTMMLGTTYRSLQGDAKDSPLTKSPNSTSANAILTYRF